MTPEEEAQQKKEEWKKKIEAKELIDAEISGEMRKAYINYAMSVIVQRALPCAEDGLKPVHRRILWAMHLMGLQSNKQTKKSARIVGDVLGKFHPHGDVAVYDAMVRLAQNFSLRYPLIKGQGNFGSMDGDPAAAMRYCVSGDSLIVTENGLQRIDNISDKEDLALKILSKDKKIHNASEWFDSGDHETLRITTNKGYELTGSKNHPVLTISKDEWKRPIFEWKLLEKLSPKDIVVIDRQEDNFWPKNNVELTKFYPAIKNKKTKIRILPKDLNEELSFISGLLVAEGWITNNKLEFCNADKELIDLFESKWKKVFPDSTLHKFKRDPSSYGKKTYFRLECHCRYTLEFLKKIGLNSCTSEKKEIPSLILKSPKSVVSNFIKAYFEGDGSISYSKKMIELSCCSKSERLIKQLQVVFLRFGIDTFRRFDKYKSINKLYLRGQRNILRFYKSINFACNIKRKKLEIVLLNYKKDSSLTDFVPFISDYLRGLSNSSFIQKNNFDRYSAMKKNYQQISSILLQKTNVDYSRLFEYFLTYNYLFDEIVKIEDSGVQRVYSLKVESDCHTFVSNGFINHNTEAKMEKISEELLQDIEKKTVNFRSNFDNSLEEPDLLPGKIPNLLLNGASGIAVGMATNMPPHNLTNTCDAILQYIDNPEIEVGNLAETIQAPDFPTGGYVAGDIKEIYEKGRGRLILTGKTKIEEDGNKPKIIITEIPYQINKSILVEEIANLVKDRKLPDVSDIRDESAKGKVRIVIELRKESDPKFTINRLLKFTRLQTRFDAIMLALVDGKPKQLNLKELIECYINHRRKVIRKRTEFDLDKAEKRLHIVEGLLIAQKNIDDIIHLIKKSKSAAEASESLQNKYSLTKTQTQAILETKLQQLTSLELEKLQKEESELKILIDNLKKILSDEKEIFKIIKKELNELKKSYGDERKTTIMGSVKSFEEKDLIDKKDVVITITDKGYSKRIDLKQYKEQRRGGKGVIGSDLATGDFVKEILTCSTHDYLLLFTDKGKVHWLKAFEIPESVKYSKGKALINILALKDEQISSVLAVKEFKDSLMMATKKGIVKRIGLKEFSSPRKGGIKAINLDEKNDTLISVKPISDNQEVLLVTKDGQACRFNSKDVRSIGRAGYGVTGIRLSEKDEVVSLEVLPLDFKDSSILTITKKGYGKRSKIEDYRLTSRGGKGVINLKISDKTGEVITSQSVKEEDTIIITTAKGMVIRTGMKDLRIMGRATQGVRIIKLHEGDFVTDLVRVPDVDEIVQ